MKVPAIFEVLTVVLLKIQVLWDVMLCYWAFPGVSKDCTASLFRVKHSKKNYDSTFDCLGLNMKVLWSLETPENTCPMTVPHLRSC